MGPVSVVGTEQLRRNQLTTLDVDWGHLRDTLASLYLGENDLTALPDPHRHGGHGRTREPRAHSAGRRRRWARGGDNDVLPDARMASLAQLRHLHTLELDNNHLSVLPASALPASLRSLSAQHNALVRLPFALLEPGGPARLQHLLLRGNLIRTLPRAGLRARRTLDRLDLADNNIQVGDCKGDPRERGFGISLLIPRGFRLSAGFRSFRIGVESSRTAADE